MTLQEFKAWFDGFAEGMDGVPNKNQWARIRERVGQIDGVVTTQRVFIDRYWPVYPHAVPYPYYPYTIYSGSVGGMLWNATDAKPVTYDSTAAMYTLGCADNAAQRQLGAR